MSSRYKALVKDTLIFSLGKFGSKFILFFLLPLYTHYLSTEEYGFSELVFSISQIIVPIISVMIFDGMMRFGLEKNASKSNVLLVGVVVALFDSILALFFVCFFKLYEPISQWRWFMYWNIVLYIAYNIEFNYLKINDRNKEYAFLGFTQTVMVAVLNILFLTYYKMGIRGYLYATNISYFITFFLTFIVGRIGKGLVTAKFDKRLFKAMVAYSAPLALNTIAWQVIEATDKIMIEKMINADALGIYTVASKIPALINVFIAIFQQAWGISSIKEYENSKDSSFYTNVFKVYYIGIFFACFALNSIIKPFMSIYVGNEFSDSWKYVPLLLVSASFSAIAGYYAGIYKVLKKPVNVMITVFISGAINILVNWILIKPYGIFGAVIGTFTSYIGIVLMRAVDVNKVFKLQINWLKFAVNSVLLVIHAILVSLDCEIIPCSILLIGTFAAINFNEIKRILNKLRNTLF